MNQYQNSQQQQGSGFRRQNQQQQGSNWNQDWGQNQQQQRAPMSMNMAENLLAEFGKKYNFAVYDNGVDTNEVFEVIKRTCFPSKKEATNEQLVVFLTVAKQYNLNPFTKEIYAYPAKSGGIVPIVGVDGWSKILTNHEQLNGMRFNYSDEMFDLLGEDGKPTGKTAHAWIECELTRKDRSIPTIVREYFAEVFKRTEPWSNHPIRMHRHKALIQCARYAFGLTGIYDHDDGEVIAGDYIQGEFTEKTDEPPVQQEQAIRDVKQESIEHNTQEAQQEQHVHQNVQQEQQQTQTSQQQNQNVQQQSNTPPKPFMSDAIFSKIMKKAHEFIPSRQKTAAEFIAQTETRYSITQEQKLQICQLEAQQ